MQISEKNVDLSRCVGNCSYTKGRGGEEALRKPYVVGESAVTPTGDNEENAQPYICQKNVFSFDGRSSQCKKDAHGEHPFKYIRFMNVNLRSLP